MTEDQLADERVKADLKEEMRDYMIRGNTWVDLCERFVNDDRTKELLPELCAGMVAILDTVSVIERTIEL